MNKVLIQYEIENSEFGSEPQTVSVMVDKKEAKDAMERLMDYDLYDLAESVGRDPREIFTILEIDVKGELTPEELGFEEDKQ